MASRAELAADDSVFGLDLLCCWRTADLVTRRSADVGGVGASSLAVVLLSPFTSESLPAVTLAASSLSFSFTSHNVAMQHHDDSGNQPMSTHDAQDIIIRVFVNQK